MFDVAPNVSKALWRCVGVLVGHEMPLKHECPHLGTQPHLGGYVECMPVWALCPVFGWCICVLLFPDMFLPQVLFLEAALLAVG